MRKRKAKDWSSPELNRDRKETTSHFALKERQCKPSMITITLLPRLINLILAITHIHQSSNTLISSISSLNNNTASRKPFPQISHSASTKPKTYDVMTDNRENGQFSTQQPRATKRLAIQLPTSNFPPLQTHTAIPFKLTDSLKCNMYSVHLVS